MTPLRTRRLTGSIEPPQRLALWARLARNGVVVQRVLGCSPCFEWTGARNSKAYGNIKVGGRNYVVSGLACFLAHGPRPSAKHQAAHVCHNTVCWNWEHLHWATNLQNQRERAYRRNGGSRPTTFLEESA